MIEAKYQEELQAADAGSRGRGRLGIWRGEGGMTKRRKWAKYESPCTKMSKSEIVRRMRIAYRRLKLSAKLVLDDNPRLVSKA